MDVGGRLGELHIYVCIMLATNLSHCLSKVLLYIRNKIFFPSPSHILLLFVDRARKASTSRWERRGKKCKQNPMLLHNATAAGSVSANHVLSSEACSVFSGGLYYFLFSSTSPLSRFVFLCVLFFLVYVFLSPASNHGIFFSLSPDASLGKLIYFYVMIFTQNLPNTVACLWQDTVIFFDNS